MFDSRVVKRSVDDTVSKIGFVGQSKGNFVTVFFNTSSNGRIESVTKRNFSKDSNTVEVENASTKVDSEINIHKYSSKFSKFDYKKSKIEKLPSFNTTTFTQSVHANICFGNKTSKPLSFNVNNNKNETIHDKHQIEFCNSKAFVKEKAEHLQRIYNDGKFFFIFYYKL